MPTTHTITFNLNNKCNAVPSEGLLVLCRSTHFNNSTDFSCVTISQELFLFLLYNICMDVKENDNNTSTAFALSHETEGVYQELCGHQGVGSFWWCMYSWTTTRGSWSSRLLRSRKQWVILQSRSGHITKFDPSTDWYPLVSMKWCTELGAPIKNKIALINNLIIYYY